MSQPDRKQHILRTAIDLLATRGLSGMTHRAIDQAAGLPQGSTSYYYSKKAALLEATAAYLIVLLDEDCETFRTVTQEIMADGRRDEVMDFALQELLRFADDGRALLLARFELTMAGARDETLKPIATGLTEAAKQPIAFFLDLLLENPTPQQVETCTGLLDGLTLLYVTGQGPKPTKEQITRILGTI